MKDTKVKEDGKIDYIWYKNQYDRLLREKCKYEHRIEKAIKYIEEERFIKDGNLGIYVDLDYDDTEHLLNILKGEEK